MHNIQLILHIGGGITSTSSIQNTLQKNIMNMKKQGYWYLGLLLENIDDQKYIWQNTARNKDFHALSKEEVTEQVLNIFEEIMVQAKNENIHTLIWSNESFLDRNENIYHILNLLSEKGIELKIIVYSQEYVSWARSAYIQWGIKHKTYKGNLQSFHEWIPKNTPKFYSLLKNIVDRFPNQLFVRNMDGRNDIVEDFCHFCHLDISDFKIKLSDQSPSNEELFFRALFNSQYQDIVLPNRFNQLVSRKLDSTKTPVEYLNTLLPSQEDLEQVREESIEDRELLNKLLISQNQETIDEEPIVLKSLSVKSDILLMNLCKIILHQSIKINNIEKILKDKKLKN